MLGDSTAQQDLTDLPALQGSTHSEQEGKTQWPPDIPSNPNYSMIL